MLTATKRAERLAEIDREQARIEDACTRENGGKFTAEQRKRYDALNSEYSQLQRQDASEPLPRKTQTDSCSALVLDSKLSATKRATWLNLATGDEVRTYARDERIAADYDNADELSLGRFIRGVVTGNWRGAGAEKMALSGGGIGGSVLVPDPLAAQWLDLARAQSVLFQAGMVTVDMTADSLRIAKLREDPTFEVKSENVAFVGSDMTFGAVNMYTRTIGTIITLSREIAEDAPNVSAAVEDVLARSLAVTIDGLCLTGNGGGDGIMGIITDPDVPSTGSIGAIAWEDLHAAAVSIRALNYNPNAYILHPTIAGDCDILASGDGTNSAKLWLGPPPSLNGVTRYQTTGITTANAIVGEFRHCLFGFRTGAMIETSNIAQSAFEKHQIKVKITQRFAFAVAQPNAFHVLGGITT